MKITQVQICILLPCLLMAGCAADDSRRAAPVEQKGTPPSSTGAQLQCDSQDAGSALAYEDGGQQFSGGQCVDSGTPPPMVASVDASALGAECDAINRCAGAEETCVDYHLLDATLTKPRCIHYTQAETIVTCAPPTKVTMMTSSPQIATCR